MSADELHRVRQCFENANAFNDAMSGLLVGTVQMALVAIAAVVVFWWLRRWVDQ